MWGSCYFIISYIASHMTNILISTFNHTYLYACRTDCDCAADHYNDLTSDNLNHAHTHTHDTHWWS